MADLFLNPAELDQSAQEILLNEIESKVTDDEKIC